VEPRRRRIMTEPILYEEIVKIYFSVRRSVL